MAAVTSSELDQLRAEVRRLSDALLLSERDRQHLLFDLHDGVVQDLTAAAMLFEGARRHVRFESEEASENFGGGLRLLRDAIAEARGLIRGVMVAENSGESLTIAVQRIVEKVRRDLELPVTVESDCGSLVLPSGVQHLLVRIVQEALYNAWKHARAGEVAVRLNTTVDDGLELTIADNGIGFEPTQVPAGHFGLESIRARARALGAELVFDTAPNHGTRVVVRLKHGL